MIQLLPSTSPWLPLWMAPSQDPSRNIKPPDWRNLQNGSALLRDKRIVIVEDEGLTQIQLRKICLLAGMEVVGVAADGEQGVEQVLRTQPDMVLMDIKMPILDGLSAAERILQELSVCMMMLTAYDLDDYKEQAQALGACGYVFKPVSASSLIPQMEAAYTEFRNRPA